MKIVILFFAFFIHYSIQAFNHTLAVDFVHLADIAYCNKTAFENWNCGDDCSHFPKGQILPLYYNIKPTLTGSIGYVMFADVTNKFLVFTFRGTTTSYQLFWEICNEVNVAYTLHQIPDAVVMKYFYNHYLDVREDFKSHFLQFRSQFPDYTVVFTAHSLGAGLLTHAAMDAILSGWVPGNQSIMYTFGSPRVGNLAFAQKLVNSISEIWRITHWKDFAPHVPLCKKEKGVCITGEGQKDYNKTGQVIWYAWHVWPEIFFDEDSKTSTICTGAEDPKCADQFALTETDVEDHYNYMGVHLLCGNKFPLLDLPPQSIRI